MTRSLAVGLVQWGSDPLDAAPNLEASITLAGSAFDEGADVVILPELAVSGYTTDERHLREVAESVEGETVGAWRDLAAQFGGFLCGGFCESVGDHLFNSAVLVGEEGVVLHYRKLHLFSEEKMVFTPGDLGLPVATTKIGTFGVCVCYDLRFPEVIRALSLKGAELICVPTAWLPGFDQQRWDAEGYCPQARGVLLQSNLSQVFIACASQVGSPGELEFLGSSVLADPFGTDLSAPPSGSSERISVTGIDLDECSRAQTRDRLISPRADRRTDVYGLTIDGRVL